MGLSDAILSFSLFFLNWQKLSFDRNYCLLFWFDFVVCFLLRFLLAVRRAFKELLFPFYNGQS